MRKSRENGLFLNVPDEQWNDWKWQVENRIETLEDLKKYITLTEEEEEGIKATLGRLRMAITPYYLSLIDLNDPYDPIRKQAIPTEHELEFAPYEDADPLHEDIDSPCPGLTHRYPDRVLLLITDLSANRYSMAFINAHGSERFFKHNSALLFGDRGADLAARIKQTALDEE